jgi:hypothetical protein
MVVVGGALSSKKGPDLESRMSRRKGVTPRSAEKRLDALSAGDNERPCNTVGDRKEIEAGQNAKMQHSREDCEWRWRTGASGKRARVDLSSRALLFGRLLGQQMQKLRPNRELEILNLGSQPDSVLFRGHAQLIATGYETSTAGQVTTALPETRKILVEHRAKEPSVITLLCRMYRCCINTHAELISIRIPCFANLSLPSRAIFSLHKRAVTTDDVSATAVSNSNA